MKPADNAEVIEQLRAMKTMVREASVAVDLIDQYLSRLLKRLETQERQRQEGDWGENRPPV